MNAHTIKVDAEVLLGGFLKTAEKRETSFTPPKWSNFAPPLTLNPNQRSRAPSDELGKKERDFADPVPKQYNVDDE